MIQGCATSNFAKSSNPVRVQQEFIRTSPLNWGGTKIFRIGSIEFGYLPVYENDQTFTVDSGEDVVVRVWYYANRGRVDQMFYQTDLVDLRATLRPNGNYQVQSDYKDTTVKFKLVDLDTGKQVATSGETEIILRRDGTPR
jgi:hypothetical protein